MTSIPHKIISERAMDESEVNFHTVIKVSQFASVKI